MHITTRQGQALTVRLEAIQRIPAGHPEPIVSFRYPGGIECSCYYLSTLQAIPSGEGLRLTDRLEIAPDTVAACQAQCAAWMREVLQA